MAAERQALGALGEAIALQELLKQGMELVARNWRCRAGEIDLVMTEGGGLVFVEVKSRYAGPAARRHLFDNVSFNKRRRLRRLAEIFLMLKFGRGRWPAARIDVVGVLVSRESGTASSVEHLKGVV